MNALERIHKSLTPDGVLLDMHPVVPPHSAAEAGGTTIGDFDESEFVSGRLKPTDAGLDEVVRRGDFALEEEIEFDFREHFDSAEELLETVREWEDTRIPRGLERRIRAAEPPLAVRSHVVLRRLRKL